MISDHKPNADDIVLCVYEINGGAEFLTNSQFAKLNFVIYFTEWKRLDSLLLWNYYLSLIATVVSGMRSIVISGAPKRFSVPSQLFVLLLS
jgi:hypothetical protein